MLEVSALRVLAGELAGMFMPDVLNADKVVPSVGCVNSGLRSGLGCHRRLK